MKISIFLSCVFIFLVAILFTFNNYYASKEVIINEERSYLNTDNMMSMMYETASGSGEYMFSSDNTWLTDCYIFNERLSGCENGGKLTWDDERKTVTLSTNVSDKCYLYFDVVVSPTLVEYITTQVYTGTDGENGLYYHDADLANGAQDNSYRYSGANPNNYVCFGPGAENEGTCGNDNLYRIVGVFDDDKDGTYQVKLIKSDYTTSDMLGTNGRDYAGNYTSSTSFYKGSMDTSTIATYRWNYDTSVSSVGSNNWTTSEFNTINLNTNYWNYLGTTWQNLIAETTWHLGGMAVNGNTAKEFYNGERNNSGYVSNPTTYSDEIGLMYPSDYGYAASPDAWTNNLSDYDNSTITASNWLYMGLYEWTVSPDPTFSYNVLYVVTFGYLNDNNANGGYAASGSSAGPYKLSVN